MFESHVRVSEDYIADDYVTLKLKGLRYITKEDYWRCSPESDRKFVYILKWAYKGQVDSFEYSSIVDYAMNKRDAMYDVVSLALTKPKKEDLDV